MNLDPELIQQVTAAVLKALAEPEVQQVYLHHRKPLEREGYLTISDIARRFGVCDGTIRDRIKQGRFPAPTHKLKSRYRYYRIEELEALRDGFNSAAERVKAANVWSQEKLWNITQAARELGMPYITFKSWLIDGTIEPPKIVGKGGWKHYTRADLDKIKEIKKDYFANR